MSLSEHQQRRLRLSPAPRRRRAILLAAVAGSVAALALGAAHVWRQDAPTPPRAVTARERPAALLPAERPTADRARAVLADAVSRVPADPATHLELALFYRGLGDSAGAERELIACARRFPRFARAPYHLGMLYLAQGRDQEAVAPLRAAAQLSPADPLVQVNAALACFRAGDTGGANAYLRTALALDARLPEAYLLLARLNDHHGTAKIALAHLRRYLQYSPDPAPGQYLMGRIYARLGLKAEAEQWLKRAVATDPNNPDFWATLGRVYYELANVSRAQEGIRCYEKALALAPNHADAHRYLGAARLQQRRFDEAVTHLNAALQVSADPGPIYYDLGRALLNSGHPTEGRQALAKYQAYRAYTTGFSRLSRAVNAAPRDRAARLALARFCLEHQQYGPALEALRETARVLGPDETVRHLLETTQTHQAAARAAAARAAAARAADPPPAPGGTPADGR